MAWYRLELGTLLLVALWVLKSHNGRSLRCRDLVCLRLARLPARPLEKWRERSLWVQKMKKQAWINVILATGAWGLAVYLGVEAFLQIGSGKRLPVYLLLILFATLFVIAACIYSAVAFLYAFRAINKVQRDEQGFLMITPAGHEVTVAKPPRLIKEIGDPMESQSRYAIFSAGDRFWVCKASEFLELEKE